MSTTHFIASKTPHDPMSALIPLKFNFDAIEHVRSVKSEVMRESLLTSMAWSADALINARLGQLLSSFYKSEPEADTIHPWDTYQEFLGHVSSLKADAQTLEYMGLDAVDVAQQLQTLYSIRLECHRLAADGKMSYTTPDLEEFILKPRLRTADGDTLLKWDELADYEAEGNKELKVELLDAYKLKHKAESLAALEWDKQRAQVLVLLLRAFKLTDAQRDVSFDDEYQPFMRLDAGMQYKVMTGMRRAIDRFIERAATDRKVTALEFAKMRVERKAYVKTLDTAMAHNRFADFQ
jgi:hypothetical protein